MLIPALERSGDNIPITEVFDHIASSKASLWVIKEDDQVIAAMVLHLPDDRDSLMVWLMGGKDFKDWCDTAIPLLQAYAQQHGKHWVECNARPGIGRELRKHGWRTTHELIRLAV